MLGKIAIALLLAVQAGPKATEQDSGFDSDDIIVEGSRDQKRQINAFVEALTQARIDGQISRFEWTVCPAAVGLSPEKNEQVSARMKLVAAAAGIKVTDGGCRPNVLVIFTNNKRTMVEALYQRFPAYFSSMTPAEARKLAKLPGPAVAWQIEGMVDRDGVPLARTG
ncbi:MAG TPA: hypothetical protein VM346_07305 [Sphingomicrobium sp.]|nr:hypothetical protein [Sphingomicrobium sp.]